MRRSRVVVLVVALLVTVLLAGCSEIPTSGSVQAGSTVAPNAPNQVFEPNPPAAGASPKDIVSGFLQAASEGGRFTVARQFLTTGFSSAWQPGTRVLVQGDDPSTLEQRGTSSVALRVPIVASVDGDGVYATTSRTVPLRFHLVQEKGQWRIDQAENGIVLAQEVFLQRRVPVSLQFFDPTWRRLVPDLRWLPNTGTPAEIVGALVSGPSSTLTAGSVTATSFPAGTEVEAVDDGGSGGVTVVSLRVPGAAPDAPATTRMQQQLLRSLQLTTPTALRLVVNGRTAPQAKALSVGAGSLSPFVVMDGRFGTLQQPAGTLVEERTLGRRVIAAAPVGATVSVSQGLAAVRSADGVVSIVTAGGTRAVPRRFGLIDPAVDQRGWVYTVPQGDPEGLQATDARGRTVDVAGDLGGLTVTAIEVSPDGTRMLALVQTATGPVAFVAGIQRAADGTPLGLTAAHNRVTLGTSSGQQGRDATWVDDDSVAVLASGDNQTERVVVQQLGGVSRTLGPLVNATSIVGTTEEQNLRVRLQSGDLEVWRSNVWQSEATDPVDVAVLAVQR